MMNYKKYTRQYFMPPERCMDWADKEYVDHAPVWCSVDLRDGNQALVVPMTLQQKLDFFQMLVKIGFKEIEVGFPAASETEYEFLRALIEQNLIPDDVTVQVLTQAREHIIRKTFEALKGVKNAIVHVYNSTSLSQREQVFRKSKEEILRIAVEGANLLQQIWYVELPAIKNIIVIQFILQAGNIMSIGFEKAYALQTDMNLPASEILSTYVYRIGLLNGDYGYSTAVGLFNSVVNVIMLIFVICVVKKLNDGEGL